MEAIAVWGCNRDNLSPPVLAKNKGTAVFRLVPLQGEVSGSVSRMQPHTALERTLLMDTVLHYEGEVSGSVSRIQPHTASQRPESMTTVPFIRQRNTSPASNTKHDKSADAAPESDTFH